MRIAKFGSCVSVAVLARPSEGETQISVALARPRDCHMVQHVNVVLQRSHVETKRGNLAANTFKVYALANFHDFLLL